MTINATADSGIAKHLEERIPGYINSQKAIQNLLVDLSVAQFIRGLRDQWITQQILQSEFTGFEGVVTKAIALEVARSDRRNLLKTTTNHNFIPTQHETSYETNQVQHGQKNIRNRNKGKSVSNCNDVPRNNSKDYNGDQNRNRRHITRSTSHMEELTTKTLVSNEGKIGSARSSPRNV
ncbi:uncharacterized protein LOC116169202 [Photinus pyralis]|uniref:uncharacterized protein LOC116163846 n=1 Tax=Photinus pyralis TaxID=7054 RepID=UPI001267425B|nr:uncharacterized protein LOC116163846 [Photinus pyralis]XP_031341091.1 uncharacterized protein LOC116169202 [Photinus pyralis]